MPNPHKAQRPSRAKHPASKVLEGTVVRKSNGLWVKRHPFKVGGIDTGQVVYSAWEPSPKIALSSEGPYVHAHGHVTSGRDFGRDWEGDAPKIWMGQVGTERPPAHLERWGPVDEEKQKKVRTWREQTYKKAYTAILKAFPETRSMHRSMGEISKLTPSWKRK